MLFQPTFEQSKALRGSLQNAYTHHPLSELAFQPVVANS